MEGHLDQNGRLGHFGPLYFLTVPAATPCDENVLQAWGDDSEAKWQSAEDETRWWPNQNEGMKVDTRRDPCNLVGTLTS